MIKKIIPLLIAFSFVLSSPLEEAFTVEASMPTPAKDVVVAKATTVAKKPAVKKKAKKKVTKKKEKLITNPPLITLDTAPHSPKKVAVKKKAVKKKV